MKKLKRQNLLPHPDWAGENKVLAGCQRMPTLCSIRAGWMWEGDLIPSIEFCHWSLSLSFFGKQSFGGRGWEQSLAKRETFVEKETVTNQEKAQTPTQMELSTIL
jgi:hypothetical protein